MNYTTQMNAAKKGIITPEMKIVAAKEKMNIEELKTLIAQGKVVIPANKYHTCINVNGIGSMLKTKINVNLGTSRDWKDLDMELKKANDAVNMGVESIMDLSSYGDTQKFRRKLTKECPAIIGTVPIYDAVVYYHKPLKEITARQWIDIVEMHACRPGSIEDAGDISQIEELVTLGELTKRAWQKDVQVIVEGPGHMALNQIEANIKIQQTICQGAPFYVLGPLVTDIAPGYDHITAAIGGALAAANGAAFLCYVTPAEHLRLPDLNDVKEGIIASKIAAHAADIAKGIKGAKDLDYQMSCARKNLDWEKMFELAIDPKKARTYRQQAKPEKEDTCSMCGNFCAIKNMNRILNGEIVNIYDE